MCYWLQQQLHTVNIFRDESEPEMVEDMTAEKPEGWLDDEPELVPDEGAEKPSDWFVQLTFTV